MIKDPVNFIVGILFLVAFVFGLIGEMNPIVSSLQAVAGIVNLLIGIVGDN